MALAICRTERLYEKMLHKCHLVNSVFATICTASRPMPRPQRGSPTDAGRYNLRGENGEKGEHEKIGAQAQAGE